MMMATMKVNTFKYMWMASLWMILVYSLILEHDIVGGLSHGVRQLHSRL